jgi:hypothetical protein
MTENFSKMTKSSAVQVDYASQQSGVPRVAFDKATFVQNKGTVVGTRTVHHLV